MANASYDAIMIGGGHNGLIVACYLQDAGLETAIFERLYKLGGGAWSEELILPGFVSSPFAGAARLYGHPVYEDFKLREKGMKHGFIDKSSGGTVFDDETCIVGHPSWVVVDPATGQTEFSTQNWDKNLKAISRFSEKDAETAQFLLEKYQQKWRTALRDYLYSPPPPFGEKDAMEKLLDDPESGMEPVYQFMPLANVAYDLFESAEMRCFFMRAATTATGLYPSDTFPLSWIIHSLSIIFSWAAPSVVIGGTYGVSSALQRAYKELGGKAFVQCEVDKILMENGRATGIRLQDGTEIEAKRVIVADIDLHQLMFRLIGEENVSPQIAKRVRNINYDRGQLFVASVAMHELPKYKAASWDPDCNSVYRLNIMPKDPEYMVERQMRESYNRGFSEKLCLFTVCNTICDTSITPEGKHLIWAEQYTAPLRYFSEREWLKMKKDLAKELVRQWEQYAPNMTWDNVIGIHVSTPYDVANTLINAREGSGTTNAGLPFQFGRFRTIPELSGYRMPLQNLYLCSGDAHPGWGLARATGYNCFKLIAQDLGLKKIWEEKGRPV